MKTHKIWFEAGKKIPQFKRLVYEEVELAPTKIIREGIHPEGLCHSSEYSYSDMSGVNKEIERRLNKGEYIFDNLKEFGFSDEVSVAFSPRYYHFRDELKEWVRLRY